VTRVPLLSGSRIVVVDAGEDGVILRPRTPAEPIADVAAAVRDALRFPLSGEPLEALIPRGGRVTIVVEPPALPLPSAPRDPRHAAIAATVDELERIGVSLERQTILVAGGLARRPGHRDLELLVAPDFARRFRGRVEVHDAENPALAAAGVVDGTALRVNRALVEADTVVVVSAAETVLHGGPSALLGAAGPEAVRAAGADSLLEPSSSSGWQLALTLERALSARLPVIGVSLVLNELSFGGALRGYPQDEHALDRVSRSPLPRFFSWLPGRVRERVLRSLPVEVSATAAFAGPCSVAHAEALLRGIELRAARLEGKLDAICIGIPAATPYLPRERPNPLLAAYLGLALALRLWRDSFPLVEGGTAILLHRFQRHFVHPTQQPYRRLFEAMRLGREPELLVEAESAAAGDERALAAYRQGRACHPLLPFADWDACRPALSRLGAVLVAGCRDAVAARQLGFVPTHGLGAALAMAHGRAEGAPRIGYLLAPPYFPLAVTG
jgi:hypothetical protein